MFENTITCLCYFKDGKLDITMPCLNESMFPYRTMTLEERQIKYGITGYDLIEISITEYNAKVLGLKSNTVKKFFNKNDPFITQDIFVDYLSSEQYDTLIEDYTDISPNIYVIKDFIYFDNMLSQWKYKDNIDTAIKDIKWSNAIDIYNISDITFIVNEVSYTINKEQDSMLYNVIESSTLLKSQMDTILLSRLRLQKKDELRKKVQDNKDNVYLQYGTFRVKDTITTIQDILRNKANYQTSFTYNIKSTNISLTNIPISYTRTLGAKIESHRSYARVFLDIWELRIDETPLSQIENIKFTPLRMLNLDIDNQNAENHEQYITFGIDDYYTMVIDYDPLIQIVSTVVD